MQNRTVLNWSSGKDAAMAYGRLLHDANYKVTHLLTSVSDEHDRVVMHGVREELLELQASSIGLPLKKVKLPASPSDELYKTAMLQTMNELKAEGITTAAFGDIFLEDLKAYREEQLKQVDMQAVFPLWGSNTRALAEQLTETGIKAMIVCVNEKYLGKEFLGRIVDKDFLNDLPANVDPCGENGEFHTFVADAPFFSAPVSVTKGEIVYTQYSNDDSWDTGFYFLDLLPA